MKRVLMVCGMFLLCCCSTRKVSTELMDYTKVVSGLRELVGRYEKRTEVYKDSLMMVKGLIEKSSNVADSVSHLETSYALSDAVIRSGKLYHSIENRDSIPGRVQYVFVEIEKRDTIHYERVDTIYRERKATTNTVLEKKRFGDVLFYTSGWLACIMVGCAGIWFLYKVMKNEK